MQILPQTTFVLSVYESPVDSHKMLFPHSAILLLLQHPQPFPSWEADPPRWASWLFADHSTLTMFIHLSQQSVIIHKYAPLDRLRTC